jgi:hypothetical protein
MTIERCTTGIRRLLLALALTMTAPAFAFDHSHAAWDALLKEHVAWLPGGHASQVSYSGFQQDRVALKAYLGSLSAVGKKEFDGWSRNQKLAFLINAYNAFTVELILTRYPDLESIRDLGSLIRSPWKTKFFTLLGEPRHLDEIEHGMIRAKGVYDDPRIHMAVNCAAIGCPALRPEAYVSERLDSQLDDQVLRFMSDRTRNRYDPQRKALQVSKIFDWYEGDFEQGHRGIDSPESFFAGYAVQLADRPEDQQAIREKSVKIRYLEYDWALNDRR